MAVKLFEFQSAVRGYHYYMKYWSPSKSQVLDCMHQEDNPYDFLAIKTCEKLTGRTVGHLPIEISRSIKYLLQRGAIVEAKLLSTDYRQSPLVQRGLEIPCNVIIKMPSTLINKKIIEKFKVMLDVLYVEPDGSVVVGSFLHHTLDHPLAPTAKISKKGKARKRDTDEPIGEPSQQRPKFVKDIRTYFGKRSSSTTSKAPKRSKCVIGID